ncbi:cytochrome P450 [Artomyces pyxidatus]|uniref:Cytochrome P450 n=1 Tax=Artomyces pyxidatus TaxID=48021 RepID=A0ACB8T5X0_9AGAM|nr:cytochrome P450 [Artomyces pyxidatus]
MLSIYELVSVLLCLGLVKAIRDILIARESGRIPSPPGAPRLPIIGNALTIPKRAPWEVYATWWQKYNSDLVGIYAFGHLSIIVNTRKAARELYERRSTVYADRPQLTMINLMGWDFDTSLIPYNDEWRAHRKIFHHNLNTWNAPAHHPVQLAQTEILLKSLYTDPHEFENHLRRYAASIALSIAYGYNVDSNTDNILKIAEEAIDMVSKALVPGAMAVNAIPALRYLPDWFPGTGFKQFAKRSMDLVTKMQDMPFAHVKRSMAEGTASPSVASSEIELINARGEGEQGEKYLKRALGTFFTAGADTTFSALLTGILALVLHPAVQTRARAELDQVVGRGRLPTFADRSLLPYVTAICRETLRWHIVSPLTIPHCPTQDDVYDGMFIPKGTPIMMNAWAILHNHDPDAFKPERFLTEEGTLNDDEVPFVFGLGRRNCAGMHFASATLWIMMASVLAVFNISKARDEQGNDIPVEVAYTDGMVSTSLPFRCSIQPRDHAAEELMEQIGDANV